jgi:sialic acid synthase SpsE
VKLGGRDLHSRVLVVAEIGNNHEGSLEAAEAMVRAAAKAGAGAVKFQTFQTAEFVRPSDEARFARLSKFELSPAAFARLAQLAREEGVAFLSTPLDLPSVGVLASLVDAFKIASGDNNFYPLLDAVAATGRPVIVSTGLSDWPTVQAAKQRLEHGWGAERPGLAFLHCVSCYPAPAGQLNLRVIPRMIETLDCPIGYSDHTLGIDACLTAVALGARIVEKHFTLDKNYSDFRDHQLSATPAEFAELAARVREVSDMLGDADKAVTACEQAMVTPVRRSIVAAANLPAGHRVGAGDLRWQRPGDGLPPGREGELVGRVLRRSVTAGENMTPDLVS